MTNCEFRQKVAKRHEQVVLEFNKLADEEKCDSGISQRTCAYYRGVAARHAEIAKMWRERAKQACI